LQHFRVPTPVMSEKFQQEIVTVAAAIRIPISAVSCTIADRLRRIVSPCLGSRDSIKKRQCRKPVATTDEMEKRVADQHVALHAIFVVAWSAYFGERFLYSKRIAGLNDTNRVFSEIRSS
jgi:hypothetical protein